MKECYLLIDRIPLKGSLNMAIDEFLFNSLGNEPQTCVRFYQWEKPTASLGYSQSVSKVIDLEFCQSHGIDVVRRITGGKLVLHHQEVTYSVCSSDTQLFTSTLKGSYRLISQALVRGMEKMGLKPCLAEKSPSFYARSTMPCFSHPAPNEIEIEGKKIVGSAQKRMGRKFLQHGSIPLWHDKKLLRSVALFKEKNVEVMMTSLSETLGQKVDFKWAVDRLVAGISEFFKVSFRAKILNSQEMHHIFKIQKEKYESKDWILGQG